MTNPDLRRDGPRLFPEAYRHTIAEGAPVRLPEPRTWWLMVAGLIPVWIITSTIAWAVLTRSTRATLDITMHALGVLTDRVSTTTTANEAKMLRFSSLSGTFRLELPPGLPLGVSGDRRGIPTVAPLLIGVQGLNSSNAQPSSQLRAWLSTGTIALPDNPNGTRNKARTVVAVEPMQGAPPAMTAGGTTLLFFVDPGLTSQEASSHPQLIFPPSAGYGISVANLTLYLPSQSAPSITGPQ